MNKKSDLIKEHTDLLSDLNDFNIIDPKDPDLLRMEEIMEELKEIEEKED